MQGSCLIGAAHDDLERVTRQGTLQGFRFVPRRTHPDVTLLVKITGIALGSIGHTLTSSPPLDAAGTGI
jgi:hypothetical protein